MNNFDEYERISGAVATCIAPVPGVGPIIRVYVDGDGPVHAVRSDGEKQITWVATKTGEWEKSPQTP